VGDDQGDDGALDEAARQAAARSRLQDLVNPAPQLGRPFAAPHGSPRVATRFNGSGFPPCCGSGGLRGRQERAYHPPPSAAAIGSGAARAWEPPGPPACAMSGRPPPPLPPSASAPLRTRSMALKRPVRSAVTPTTMPALPSSVTPTIATTPEPTCFLPSSARLLRSLSWMPVTDRAIRLTSPTLRTPSPLCAGP